MKFVANLSTLFPGSDILEAFELAGKNGFKYVEAQHNIYDHTLQEVFEAKEKSGVEVVMINTPLVTESIVYPKKELFGIGTYQVLDHPFITDCIQPALDYANKLECKMVHVIGGLNEEDENEYGNSWNAYQHSIRNALAVFEDHCITPLIEPICARTKPGYILDSYERALEIIDATPGVKLLLDVFHLYQIEGDLRNLQRYLPYAGHVQVSQSPNRNEPLAKGDINYDEVFAVLRDRTIGLEYTPSGEDVGFDWIKKF